MANGLAVRADQIDASVLFDEKIGRARELFAQNDVEARDLSRFAFVAGRAQNAGFEFGAQRKTREIEQFGAQYTQVMTSFEWNGPDADRTRETWGNDYMNMLRQVSQALETFSTLINNQAQEQEQVSS